MQRVEGGWGASPAARPERETRGAPRYDRAAGFVHGFFVAARRSSERSVPTFCTLLRKIQYFYVVHVYGASTLALIYLLATR